MGLFSGPNRETERCTERLDAQERRVREVLEELRELERSVEMSLRSLGERFDSQGKHLRIMAEELDERIDRGNKIWRKIRASEYYEKEREEREGEAESYPNLSLFDGESGQGEGVQPVHPGLAHRQDAESKAQEVGKALARRIAGLE
jgi:hypothetical protein